MSKKFNKIIVKDRNLLCGDATTAAGGTGNNVAGSSGLFPDK
jgi:hypothetical protein